MGNAQNFARELAEAPANFLTPTQFVEEAITGLAGLNIRQESTGEKKRFIFFKGSISDPDRPFLPEPGSGQNPDPKHC